jgi:DNA-directed RNA polymerase sigma subunit (sigma70/sigma32)
LKYESITKVDRNNHILVFYKNHPELSLEEIGKEYGITKQRVWQILKRELNK